MTPGGMIYDLRCLGLHCIIERIDHTNRYQLTRFGLQIAVSFARSYSCLLRTGLTQIWDPYCSDTLLRLRFDQLETAIADMVDDLDLVAQNLTQTRTRRRSSPQR